MAALGVMKNAQQILLIIVNLNSAIMSAAAFNKLQQKVKLGKRSRSWTISFPKA